MWMQGWCTDLIQHGWALESYQGVKVSMYQSPKVPKYLSTYRSRGPCSFLHCSLAGPTIAPVPPCPPLWPLTSADRRSEQGWLFMAGAIHVTVCQSLETITVAR